MGNNRSQTVRPAHLTGERMKPYTEAELKRFDRLTQKLSSDNQLARIEARLAIPKFIAEHGKEKCDVMYAVLRERDKKRGRE